MSVTEPDIEGMDGPDKLKSDSERTPDQIERDIEETRARMSRDMDELGQRLSPRNLNEEAREAIGAKAHEVADRVTAGARYTGDRVLDFMQENPSLIAATGLGAVWLVQRRNRQMPGRANGRRKRRQRHLQRATDKKPLLVAAGAAILGLAIGFLVQGSLGERRIVGPARERLTKQLEHTAKRFKDAAVEAGQDLGERVKRSTKRVKAETKQAAKEGM